MHRRHGRQALAAVLAPVVVVAVVLTLLSES